jgi:hypothetical protein
MIWRRDRTKQKNMLIYHYSEIEVVSIVETEEWEGVFCSTDRIK